MAWYEPEIMCKKHPSQRQQPGFCLSCLNERLSKLPSFTFNIPPSRSSSSVSSSPAFNSSGSSSTAGSPKHRKNPSLGFLRQHSGAHGKKNSNSGGGGGGVMRKSRSITHVTARRRGRNVGLDGKSKKEGFWSKLIRSTSSKTKGALLHAKNGKERLD